MNILAIIPARGGSKGLPRKNVKNLAGKPLIYYTIDEARKSKHLTRIVVSTEDGEIAAICRKSDVEVIKRPFELATDDTPSQLVYRHAIKSLEKKNFYADIVVVLQPTSPLRKVEDIDDAIRQFMNTRCHSVVSICETEHPPHWTYTLDNENRLVAVLKDGNKITRRQDAPKTYRLNGAVFVTSKDVIIKENSIIGYNTIGYIMDNERSIDIDSELDFKIAQMILTGKNY